VSLTNGVVYGRAVAFVVFEMHPEVLTRALSRGPTACSTLAFTTPKGVAVRAPAVFVGGAVFARCLDGAGALPNVLGVRILPKEESFLGVRATESSICTDALHRNRSL
jgi:hypothetical protein